MNNLISPCGDWKVYGSEKPKVLIAGHSHTFALYSAILDHEEFSNLYGVVTQANFEKHIQQSDSYWEFVASLSSNQPVAIMWNGNQHNIHFLLDSGLKSNFYGLPINEEFPFIPISQIRELFKPTFTELQLVLDKFESNSEIILLGTPAPKNQKYLNSQLSKDPYFVDMGRQLGLSPTDLKASSDSLRAYMWNLTQEMTAEMAGNMGSRFIPTPGSTFDNSLILNPEYYSEDLTHANELFGVKMLENISASMGMLNE